MKSEAHGSATVSVASLIDPEHYGRQAGERFPNRDAAYRHFRKAGQAAGLKPSPFFYTDWYAWQNSDAARYDTVLDHFAVHAVDRPIDPAPFVDSGVFLARHSYRNMVQALSALTDGRDTSLSPRLQDHLDALAAHQTAVHAAVRSAYLRHAPTTRKRLVWVQAGPGFSTTAWFDPHAGRSWDLMCNWYSLNGIDLRHGEIHLRQSGTKSTAISHVLRHDPALLSRYDQILFLDDDLTIVHGDLDRLFDAAQHAGLDMFQAGLLPGSFCVWPDLFRRPDGGTRQTTGVEIMMPGFSRDALFDCAQLFGRSVSGFGLDFAISEHVRERGRACGVVDSVGIGHYSRIDETGGSYYRLMRALKINHKLELYAVIRERGKLPMFETL